MKPMFKQTGKSSGIGPIRKGKNDGPSPLKSKEGPRPHRKKMK